MNLRFSTLYRLNANPFCRTYFNCLLTDLAEKTFPRYLFESIDPELFVARKLMEHLQTQRMSRIS